MNRLYYALFAILVYVLAFAAVILQSGCSDSDRPEVGISDTRQTYDPFRQYDAAIVAIVSA